MGVVADAALAEPDRLANAEVFSKGALVARAIEPGIADLLVGQEPLLGDEERSLAVRLDPAAFEHESITRIGSGRLEPRQPGDALDRTTDLGVAREVRVLRPRVERPVREMHVSRFVMDEGRSRVAKPDTIVCDEMRAHVARHAVRPQVLLARGTHIVIVAEDLYPLVLREHTDN